MKTNMVGPKKVKKINKTAKKKKIVKKSPVKKRVVVKNKNKKTKKSTRVLTRFPGNPIIYPNAHPDFDSKATFNPTAFEHNGKIHVIYRALGGSDISTLGYAGSTDGYNFRERSYRPIFVHHLKREKEGIPLNYISGGGGNGGAEDPRVTKIDDRLYMTYTAFDGWGSVRIGLTSISLDDFLKHIWNWKKPVLISMPDEVNKNWVIFPEKIGGKYAIMHAISPKILITYVKSLDIFDGHTFIKSITREEREKMVKETGVRGVGAVPIKTKYGWLVFYHAVEAKDPDFYKIFAMLLDLKDPTKVLYRSNGPVLEPDAHYEHHGLRGGVVYTCGAVVKGDDLFVYYGGADTVTCVAYAKIDLFLKDLMSSGKVKLKTK